MNLESIPYSSAEATIDDFPVADASSQDAPDARDLLIRRVARLDFLIDAGAPEIIIRNEQRLVDEALIEFFAAERANDLPDIEENIADWTIEPDAVDRLGFGSTFAEQAR